MLSYRKLAMCVLGRPLHTGGGGIDLPRPASQRAAAFILTAAMLTTLAAPAFAKTWDIEKGDITVKAGEAEGPNKVKQGDSDFVKDEGDTIITGTSDENTVIIDTSKGNVDVTFDDLNIDASNRNKAAVSVTGSGNTTIKLDGDNHLTGGNGIYSNSSGSLTISGDENDSLTAQGGDSRNGIYSVSGDVTISGGTVTATGGNSTGSYGSGGDGIHSGSLTISGGTVTATGGGSTGSNGLGGRGIYSVSGDVTISGGTVTANGGNSTGSYGSGGDGISSSSGVAVSGGTVTANGGNGGNVSGDGICSFDRVAISGGTVEAAGGSSGSSNGGSGIYSSVIDLSGSLELTAKAGSPNGKALSQKGSELVLDTIKDKLGPGAKVTATDADGKVIDQVPIPRPVEPEKPVIPEESSSSSDGGSSAPSAPVSSLPGLTVTDKDGQRISYTSTQSGNTLTVCVGRFTASLRASLATLRQLRAEGIDTITFQTILCSTTLSVDELLAMGGEDAEAVLTHRLTDSSLTVG